jgi:hypothetical protein
MLESKKLISIFSTYFWIAIVLFMFSCAKEMAPTGGIQDTTPPVVIITEPQSETTQFEGKTISFKFDEFFTLKTPNQTIYLNPLSDKELKHKIKGKRLIIQLPDSLPANQTYSLVLDNAVADFNEGNLLPMLKYVFSTGSSIDSLSISGRVIDASGGDPKEGVIVYLLPIEADSALLKKQFSYISTTTSGGQFIFKNLPHGTFEMYALYEKDHNHVFNGSEEMVGFYQKTVTSQVVKINDTISINTLSLDEPLYIFQEQDTTLRIVKTGRLRKGLQYSAFSIPVADAQVKLISEEGIKVSDTIFTTINKNRDTLYIWLPGQKADIATVEISANGQIMDTISLSLKPIGRSVGPDAFSKPSIKPHIFDNNRFHYYDTLTIVSTNPIASINTDSLLIIFGEDTIDYTIQLNKENPLQFDVVFQHSPDSEYELTFMSGCITDYFGMKNDSSAMKVKTTDSSYYGTIALELQNYAGGCFIVELINNRSPETYKFKYEAYTDTIRYEGLIPGEYSIKLIADENCNGKWDSGRFLLRLAAEKVYKLPGRSIVKSSWETELIWSFE